MSTSYAFEVSSDDVANVLRANLPQVVNPGGKPIEALASDIFDDWGESEIGRVEQAALSADVSGDDGEDLDAQTNEAYVEIYAVLVDQGSLKR